MSYSFNVKAANKATAKEAVISKFDEVVTMQPSHAQDREAAQNAVFSFIDVLKDDDTRDVEVSAHGSLSGTWSGNDVAEITHGNLGITVNLARRARD